MEWYKTIEEMFAAKVGPHHRRCYSDVEGFFVAEGWLVLQMLEEGVTVAELKMVEAELAQDWGIIRTGGVASTFRGTKQAAIEHVRYLNATDEQGSSEIVTKGMSREEASVWLAEMAHR
jgi:hypothetical protein